MADNWRPLFEHANLRQTEIDNMRISTTWSVMHSMEFINTLPQDLSIPPAEYPKVFRNVTVLFRHHRCGRCKLELRRDNDHPPKAKYFLTLTKQFMEGVDLRVSKRVAAYYKWNGVQLEIKLEQALSPGMDFRNYTELKLLANKPRVTSRDISRTKLLLLQMDLRPFYMTCNDEVKKWLDNEERFNIQVYPPGVENSVDVEMWSQKGFLGLIEECSLVINIDKMLTVYKNCLRPNQELTVMYHWFAGKLELVFLTADEYPNPPSRLLGPVVAGA